MLSTAPLTAFIDLSTAFSPIGMLLHFSFSIWFLYNLCAQHYTSMSASSLFMTFCCTVLPQLYFLYLRVQILSAAELPGCRWLRPRYACNRMLEHSGHFGIVREKRALPHKAILRPKQVVAISDTGQPFVKIILGFKTQIFMGFSYFTFGLLLTIFALDRGSSLITWLVKFTRHFHTLKTWLFHTLVICSPHQFIFIQKLQDCGFSKRRTECQEYSCTNRLS